MLVRVDLAMYAAQTAGNSPYQEYHPGNHSRTTNDLQADPWLTDGPEPQR